MACYRHYHYHSLSSGMEDLPSDWLNNIFEDPLLTDKVISDIVPTPHIQADHSYSLMTEPAPPSPLLPGYQLDEFGNDMDSDGLCYSNTPPENMAYTIKQEPPMEDYEPALNVTSVPMTTEPKIQMTTTPIFTMSQPKQRLQYRVKPEQTDNDSSLHDPAMEQVQMPPTPPSSTPSDSEGGSSPHRSSEPGSPPALLSKKTTMTIAQPIHSQTHVQPAQLQRQRQQETAPGPKIVQHPVITTQLNQKLSASGQLTLSEEEKRTLIQEGYPIPTKLPLTKAEEKSLKKVRRKIKNKISAQESRRKKKEYVDCLEKRVENFSQDNNELRKKLESLENTNKSLLSQLHHLQALVNKASRPIKATSTQTGTCLMMLVLCFAIFLGSWSPTPTTDSSSYTKMPQQSADYSYPPDHHQHKPYALKSAAAAAYDPYSTPNMRSSRVLMSVTEDRSYADMPYPYMSKLDTLGKSYGDNKTEKSDESEPSVPSLPKHAFAEMDTNSSQKDKVLENLTNNNISKIHSDILNEMTEYQAIMHPDIAAEIQGKFVAMETLARMNNTSSK
ncbi:cyclic AMP-responsive element-binding protein 3-like protein 2 isoform X2 [Ptychodera flava]|uniref:cyclic AMP-responsive element-binding protein 3-like protein 2 isoform X2 n=1 Tax=Ptychodera flava TaxID=63121 RepID=UPI003969C00B